MKSNTNAATNHPGKVMKFKQCVAVLLTSISFGANASLITNGSFESGLTGWAFSDIDVVGWDSSDGNFSLDLSGSTFGGGDFVMDGSKIISNERMRL